MAGRPRLRRLRRRQPPLRDRGRPHPPPARRPPRPVPLRRDQGPQEARRARPDHRVHPQPDLRGRRPARRPHGLLRRRQRRGEDAARADRRADARASPRSASPGPASSCSTSRASTPRLMFPTLASLIEERLLDDPALTQVAIRAFNEWLHDEWRYDYEGRIFATPIVNPCVLDEGIAELERVIERGARAVLLRPAPVSGLRGHPLALPPRVRPVLGARPGGRAARRPARVRQRLPAATSTPGRAPRASTWPSGPRPSRPSPTTAAPIQDALASAICHGMLTRFPGVQPHQRRERRQLGRATSCATSRSPTRRCRNEFAEHPLRRVPAQRVGQPVLGGLGHRARRRSSAPSGCASGPTTPTPRASTTRSAGAGEHRGPAGGRRRADHVDEPEVPAGRLRGAS